ncbi:hypothetical protein ACFVS2_19640 [Brevibacillus sp. NPDC058079]|uniref:hypothetical protein n=1 Tax=Brevibacillus sp. NPDC058079 TaxID=3346330 RepID=UPI0036EF6043
MTSTAEETETTAATTATEEGTKTAATTTTAAATTTTTTIMIAVKIFVEVSIEIPFYVCVTIFFNLVFFFSIITTTRHTSTSLAFIQYFMNAAWT